MMLTGSCLCGAVTLQVAGPIDRQPESCHCSICRKQSGHYPVAVNVRRANLTIAGEENIKWYQSSEKVDRGFCSHCGTPMFWQPNMADYEYTAILMGVFNGPTGLRLAKHAFVNDKGDYYDISDNLPRSDGY